MKHSKLETLINRVNYETLEAEHRRQSRNKAIGVDKVTKDKYGENLEENLNNLLSRMKTFSYRPQPVRRVEIPKPNGKTRHLGIPSYEDKLVQGVMANILNEIYEPRFLDCSYGFRPGRKAHDAIKAVNDDIMFKKVNYILECDIKGFFDNVDHKWLMKFLENDIADKNFLRYIARFLKAGVMIQNRYEETSVGTPQGGLISPVLANVYLHYVLDRWFVEHISKQLKGEAYLVRYADDFIIMFENENEAKAVYEVLKKRLAKFGLQLAEDKTRILPFGRNSKTKRYI
ncbi:MAG: group II intron reverse transcriptase/maturase [Solobacterium sp.]|jgi:group II intron reverse transcriptase/maturase|nr:group II intron reverse transcriptase/maturase [Solobacterium sp.]MCH4206355.1 group II intron reverse transcriptase/maturase [Solobacterium sp.]MCH4227857.1 group II intron reverse transcriptase/maturase [Solobacterium sp.]MCH4283251.1 group II intron reverse transcriptase/maturase [Solobacterium sp.]